MPPTAMTAIDGDDGPMLTLTLTAMATMILTMITAIINIAGGPMATRITYKAAIDGVEYDDGDDGDE